MQSFKPSSDKSCQGIVQMECIAHAITYIIMIVTRESGGRD